MTAKNCAALQAYWEQCHWNTGDSSAEHIDDFATTFTHRLEAVQISFSTSCQHIAQQLSADADQMLLGSTLLAALHLVSEPAVWLCLCMMAWQHQFGAVRKRQGKRGKTVGASTESNPLQPGIGRVRGQLNQMQSALCEGLQAIIDAANARLKAATKPQLASATAAALGDMQQSSNLAEGLAGCFSQPDIHSVLNIILTAQSLSVKRIKLQASELLSAL